MCGRYVRLSDKQLIAELFHVRGPSIPDFGPSFNVAPQTFQPIIRLNLDTGEREIVMMRWGLIPFWSRDKRIAFSTINARAESIQKSPAFKEAFRRRRCLVPADAFYEWQKLDSKTKQPFAIAMKDKRPYAFAGLWDKWLDKVDDAELLTFTVVTTDPCALVAPLHDRMPVILREQDYDRWLKPGDPAQPPIDLLRPFDAEQMTAWKVGKEVGNVQNDTPELLRPDNVVEMPQRLSEEDLWELEGMDVRGEFDLPKTRKKRPPKLENLGFDFQAGPEDSGD